MLPCQSRNESAGLTRAHEDRPAGDQEGGASACLSPGTTVRQQSPTALRQHSDSSDSSDRVRQHYDSENARDHVYTLSISYGMHRLRDAGDLNR